MSEPPVECEVHGRTFALSSLDRVMFPDVGLTKGALVEYYDRIAERMLRYVAGRPVAVQRWPAGLGGERFFQKNAGSHYPDWIARVQVPKREGGTLDHVVLDDPATPAYLANQNAIELHTWLARADDLAHPDLFVVDLDPPEGADVGTVRAAAKCVQGLLDDLGMVGCLKTSGSKGFHVLVPLVPDGDWDRLGAFAGAFAAVLARRHPDALTDAFRKAKREGRVFVDVMRNTYGQTTVAPYSVRGLPGAPVSTPIAWDELSRVEPQSYGVANLFRRLGQKDDPWAGRWRAHDLPAAASGLRDLLDG